MTANEAILTDDHGSTSGCEGPFHTTTLKIALESPATITTADLIVFILVSAVARVFHSIAADRTWSPPR
jgi:hypothetical protein